MKNKTKQAWEYTQREFTDLIGDQHTPCDLAWLCDEGKISEEQYHLFKEALKIPLIFIIQDIEYEVKNKKPCGASTHKGMIRKYITTKKIPSIVLDDYPDLKEEKNVYK